MYSQTNGIIVKPNAQTRILLVLLLAGLVLVALATAIVLDAHQFGAESLGGSAQVEQNALALVIVPGGGGDDLIQPNGYAWSG